MRAQILAGLMAAAAMATLTSSVHASPVAMASNMVGKPTFRSGGGPWKPLGVLEQLSPGDTVKCEPGQSAVIMMFTDGIRFEVASGKTGTIEPTKVLGAQSVGDMGGATIRVAKAMTGLDTEPFLARPGHSFERLETNSPGIVIQGAPSVTWAPVDTDVASYTLTLFNQNNNVVWSTTVSTNTAELPASMPQIALKKPYVWTITEFGPIGKPSGSRWGIVTFLTQTQADELNGNVKVLRDQFTATPTDYSPLLLIAELYRSYGVYTGTAEALQDAAPSGLPGVNEAFENVFAQASPLAALLHKLDQGAASTDSATAQN